MPAQHDDPDALPSLDLETLDAVTGGAGAPGGDMMSMLPMMMMMRSHRGAGPAAAAEPWKPKVTLNGVEQQMAGNNLALTTGGNDSSSR